MIFFACETARHPVGSSHSSVARVWTARFFPEAHAQSLAACGRSATFDALVYGNAFQVRLSECASTADAHIAATSVLRAPKGSRPIGLGPASLAHRDRAVRPSPCLLVVGLQTIWHLRVARSSIKQAGQSSRDTSSQQIVVCPYGGQVPDFGNITRDTSSPEIMVPWETELKP